MCDCKWESIDSAPRDGSWFLGYIDMPMIMRWKSNLIQRFVDIGDGNYRKENYDAGEWINGTGFFYKNANPTHWMPLPQAPKDTGGK